MPRTRTALSTGLWLSVAAAGAFALAGGPLSAQGPAPLNHPIVFVKQTPVDHAFGTIADIFGNFQGFEPEVDQPVGGNLFRLDPDGTLTNLTRRPDAAVRDPEVSHDGTRVLFSMKLGPRGVWQVYEIGADGSGLRKVSRDGRFHDLDPSYLPEGRIVFTTDRNRWADGYENLPSAQLAVMNADGSGVEVLKRHPAGQFNPLVGSDGKIYFTQWDFHDRRRSIQEDNSDLDVNRFLLWKIFADGSGLDHPAFGTHTLYDFDGGYVEIRELPGVADTFVGVLANEFDTFGGGSLVLSTLTEDADRDDPIFLTPDVFNVLAANTAGRWRSPYPLADGRFVASWAAGPVHIRNGRQLTGSPPLWRLVVMDGDGSNQRVLYEDPRFWCWQPVEVAPRPRPPQVQGERRSQFPYAVLNSLDVTLRGVNEDRVVNGDFQPVPSHGQAKRVRVLREDLRSANEYEDFPDHADPDVSLLGTAPVFPDGSFAVVVPADTPLVWELLDEGGEVLVRERFGTELRAGEVRRCTGCHAPHDGSRGSTSNLALAAPTNLSGVDVDRDGDGVVDLLEAGPTAPGGPCRVGPTTLCLLGGRFRVEVRWQAQGEAGDGRAVPLADETGYFWFFKEGNVELVTKLLDGRPINGHFWFFYGALSNVEYTLRVTDTQTGVERTYRNPPGRMASFADTAAF